MNLADFLAAEPLIAEIKRVEEEIYQWEHADRISVTLEICHCNKYPVHTFNEDLKDLILGKLRTKLDELNKQFGDIGKVEELDTKTFREIVHDVFDLSDLPLDANPREYIYRQRGGVWYPVI